MINNLPIPVDTLAGVESPAMSDHLVRLKNLQAIMKARSWKQAQLALALEKSPTQINNWFSGARNIGEALARQIEEKLGLARYTLDDRPGVYPPLETTTAATRLLAGEAPPIRGTGASVLCVTNDHKLFPVILWEQVARMLDDPPAAIDILARLESFSPASSAAFFVLIPDDAMAPVYNAGDHVLLDPEAAIRAGDTVLVQTRGGELLLRTFKPRTTTAFDAVPMNDAYMSLSSTADGITLRAKVVEHRRYLR